MSHEQNPYQVYGASSRTVAHAGVDERADFIRKTYVHLGGAVAAFIGLEWAWMQMSGIENLAMKMVSGWNWLIVIGAFMLVSYVADKWASSAINLRTQYAGLSLYVVAQSIIFIPMIYMALRYDPTGAKIIIPAAVTTLSMFAVLTAIVFFTARDFSFLRPALMMGGFAAMGLIVVSMFMPFNLGIFFIAAMVVLMCGYILYHTSNVLHHYRPGQHVAASLALFAAVALLFWYILLLFMRLRD